MSDLRVSIALCTYNGEKYLREQLDSISFQTHQPYELVISDDGSSDGTLNILKLYKKNSKFPVKIIANEKNIGFLKNFENAIRNCVGDIIVLADQDDCWLPFKIESIISTFMENPQCGYVFSNAELVDENGRSLGLDLWTAVGFDKSRFRRYVYSNQVDVMLNGGNFIYGTTMAFRAKFKTECLPIETYSFSCAHDTWICLILSILGARGMAIPISLVQYRQHAKQLSGAGSLLSSSEHVKSILKNNRIEYMVLADALQNILDRLLLVSQKETNQLHGIKQLSEKVLHLRARSSILTARGFDKWKVVIREAMSGRYSQFSSGYKSILRDLFMSSIK